MFAPANEPIRKSERSSIGSRWRELEHDERDEQHRGGDEQAEDLGDVHPRWLPSISA